SVVRCARGHKLVAFAPSRARGLMAESCYANDLADPATGADWLAIAPRAILPALEPLAKLRESQGLKTKLAAPEDAGDGFGAGPRRTAAARVRLRGGPFRARGRRHDRDALHPGRVEARAGGARHRRHLWQSDVGLFLSAGQVLGEGRREALRGAAHLRLHRS